MDLDCRSLLVVLIVQKLTNEQVVSLIDTDSKIKLEYKGDFQIKLEGKSNLLSLLVTVTFNGVEVNPFLLHGVRFNPVR